MTGGDDMEMGMSEPGEMCCCCEGGHGLAETEIPLQLETRLQAIVGRIIISDQCINPSR